jgi:hypothetical protein
MQINSPHETNRFRHNPLAARLAKRAGCLGSRVAFVLAAVLGPLTSLFVITSLVNAYSYNSFLLGFLTILTVALIVGGTLSLPLFIASTSASLTVRYTHSLEYPLLCTTPLSNAQIVRGYVLAALRYVRAPLVLMLGLLPGMEMLLTHLAALFLGHY